MMHKKILLTVGLATASLATALFAAEVRSNAPPPSALPPTGKEPGKEVREGQSQGARGETGRSRSTPSTIGGQEIKYKASAGTILLRDEDDKPTASIFYIAYTREDVALSNRPVTFSFNGGPGSSSVWMHLGMLGPRRVRLAEDGSAPAAAVSARGQ